MPITIDEFESGEVGDGESVSHRVAVFLHEHRDHAFTRQEIAEAIDADPNVVGTALSRFKRAELVRHRGRYWAITEDVERLRSADDLHRATVSLNEQERPT
ncbi:MAG: helix-turn-helix domain-containing protein [Halobacteriales archaeon]